jgi:phosphomannomutase
MPFTRRFAFAVARARGDVIIVRYADDVVLGFQHREDAEQFLEQLRERLAKVGTAITRCPPHGPVLALLVHTVLT